MNPTKLWVPLLMLALASPATAVVVDFEDVTLNSYGVGRDFESNGIEFDVIAYNGTGTNLRTSSTRGALQTVLVMNNSIGIRPVVPANTSLIEFLFSDSCSSCSTTGITVNGESSLPAVQLTALDGTTLGGVDIEVILGTGSYHQMRLLGPITSFATGGTEYSVDNLRFAVPEPASLFLLGVGLIPCLYRRG